MFLEKKGLKKLLLLQALIGGGSPAVERIALGNPLTFQTDLARPLKSLLIPFTPIQQGTGDPSPSNIRSILPWNGLTVFGGGKNLLDEAQLAEESGITYENGYYTGTRFAFHTAFSGGLPILPKFKENTRYTLSATGYNSEATSNTQFVITYTDGTQGILRFTEAEPTRKTITTTNGKTVANIAISYGDKSSIIFYVKDIQLEEGTTETDYVPCSVTDTDIVFPSPVYGGEHEAVSGKLMANWIPFVFDGQTYLNSGVYDTTRGLIGAQINELPYTSQDVWVDAYSDKLKRRTSANEEYSFVIAGNGKKYCQIFCGKVSDHPEVTTKDEAKAFVSNWLQNNTVTLVYSIPTPQEQTLTSHQITALIGNNTIWSDADGSMTCIYLVSSKYADEHPVGGLGFGFGNGTPDEPDDPENPDESEEPIIDDSENNQTEGEEP